MEETEVQKSNTNSSCYSWALHNCKQQVQTMTIILHHVNKNHLVSEMVDKIGSVWVVHGGFRMSA